MAHVIFGLPGETKETAKKTIDDILSMPVDYAQFYCAVAFPGCELYEEAKRNGWITDQNWDHYEQNYSVLKTDKLKPEEIMALRDEAFRKFYFRPGIVLKTIFKIRSLGELKNSFLLLKDFLNWA